MINDLSNWELFFIWILIFLVLFSRPIVWFTMDNINKFKEWYNSYSVKNKRDGYIELEDINN